MDSDKAPGLDGFTIHFYKVCWDIIKYDLQKMVRGFMNKAKVGGSTNSTYLALIPKDSNPETFAKFRPISLCNASYKILAKLLANRIKPLLPRIVSSAQGGFVEGRHILDNVIQVQETIHSSKQRKEKGMLIKLDMANAFDRVNRSFLSKVLLSFGFSPQFVNLIKACMSNPWIAPLINGRPANFFKAKRGIRQGCPLSPFLYIIMAEALSRKLEAERLSGSLPGLKPTSNINPLNHALFADDSIFLGGASPRIAKAFDTVIKNYCKVLGALVNERKSELSSLTIYQAAFLLAPRNVKDQISSLLRNFLWQGGRGNDKKLHLVNWDTIKKPIDEGALQIRDPSLVNLALGSKILWKMIKEPLHPVSAILRSKYTNKVEFRTLQLSHIANSTLLWKLCFKSSKLFKRHAFKISGNGKSTSLWQDRIMGCNALMNNDEIAELRDWLEIKGKHSIYDISNWDQRNEWSGWAIPDPPAHLQIQKNTFLDLLEAAAPIHRSMKDRWGWGHTGDYTTAAGYRAYQITENNKQRAAFWKSVWEPLTIPKVNFFFWTLMHNKILTDCLFAKDVWDLMLQDFCISSPSQITVSDLFVEWSQFYPQRIPYKSFWRKVWNALPKFVYWQIWLARNQKIFNDLNHTPLQVVAKARSLLLEVAQQQYYKEDTLLQPVEKRWLGLLELQSRKTLLPPQTEHPIWKKRDPDEVF
eukprot:PITA_23626